MFRKLLALAAALAFVSTAHAAGPTGLLNDTGQDTFYDGANLVACAPATAATAGSLRRLTPPRYAATQTGDTGIIFPTLAGPPSTILFIDASVQNQQALLSGVSADVEIVALENDSDGVRQIAEVLKNHKNLDSIQIVSHGAPGTLALGSTALTDSNIEQYRGALGAWGNALKADGNILLFGCNVAQGVEGDHFVNRIGQLTGAAVAASIDATGARSQGGNWVLEKQTGRIVADKALSAAAMSGYEHLLLLPNGVQDVTPTTLPGSFIAGFTLTKNTASTVIYTDDPLGIYFYDPGNTPGPATFTVSADGTNVTRFDLTGFAAPFFPGGGGDVITVSFTGHTTGGGTPTTSGTVSNANGGALTGANFAAFTSLTSFSFTVTATGSTGDLTWDSFTVANAALPDTTPDAFTFTAQTGVALSTVATSDTITVAGINTVSPISIVGGTYSINGGGYTAVAGTVNNGDTVTVKQTSSGSFSTLTTATLTIGGVAGAFDVTTLAQDTTPTAFTFTAQTGAVLTTVVTSNTITVAGINSAANISIVGGTYSINGGGYTAVAGTVNNGDTVTLKQTSSGSFSTLTTATLTIGGVAGAFDVTTLAQDTTPNAFTFTAQTGVALSTVATSNTITVAGINSAANISIVGGTYSINGGGYTAVAGTVNNGDTVTLKQTSSGSYSTLTTATLTIGGVAGAFNATTLAAPAATYTAASATGTGAITASFTGGGAGCVFTANSFIPVTGGAGSPPAGTAPAGVSFPQGLFDFTTGGCTAASTLTFTITYPQALPPGTVYWKYGPTPGNAVPHWYQLPAVIAGNTATFSITDGGLGDDDLLPNGTIVDQGGPGGGGAGIPTLSEWGVILLSGLMALFGVAQVRRRDSGTQA